MAYSNVNNFIVILADKRDPYISWQNHLKRGSLGGVDCVARIGTPIYAPDDCTLSNTANNGSGGNTITMKFADGMRDQMMHLSRFVSAGPKKKGQLVGYSGDSGSPGQPHVHWHRIDPSGRRRNPWDYFSGSTSGGGGTTPIEDDMFDDTDKARLLSVFNAIFYGGPSMEDGGQSISRSLHQINKGVNAPVERSNQSQATLLPADGSEISISQAQDNADTNSMLRRLLDRPAAVVSITDEDAKRIAAAVAEALPHGTELTKEEIVAAIKSVEWIVEY